MRKGKETAWPRGERESCGQFLKQICCLSSFLIDWWKMLAKRKDVKKILRCLKLRVERQIQPQKKSLK
jgi:hypothetical protein